MKRSWSYWFLLFTFFIYHTAIAQWVESNHGIYGGTITSLANHQGNVFAGTWGGVYYSNNNAITWQQRNTGLDNTFVNAMATSGNGKVFVATQGGSRMFISAAPYTEWTIFNSGLPVNAITSLAAISNQLFAITNTGLLFTLTDADTAWTHINAGIGPINSISCSKENLFAATDNGIYLSTDFGLNWRAMNNGLIETSIYSVSTTNNYVIARARAGVTFFSADTGATWSLAPLVGVNFKLVEFKEILYAANEFRAYYSTTGGKTWEAVRTLPGARDLIVNGSTLIAGNPFGIFTSPDNFQWTARNYSNLTNSSITGFASSQNHVFCATGRGDVLRSGDTAKTWISVSRGLPLNDITAIGYFDNTLLVALSNYGIYRSDNEGASWTLGAGIARINSFVKHKNQLVAGGASGVFTSSDVGRTWIRLTNSPQTIGTLTLLDKRDTLFATSPDNGVSYSINSGQTWAFINNGLLLPDAHPTAITAFNGRTLLGTENQSPVHILETISSAWQSVSDGFGQATRTTSFATDGRNLFSAGDGGVFISADGYKWTSFYNEQFPPLSSPQGVKSLMVFQNHLFAGTEAYGVWVSCIEPDKPIISVIGNAPNDTTLVSDSAEGNQWFLNELPIPGAILPTYKPVISGTYSVKVNLNGCESEMSEKVNLIIEEYPDAIITMPTVFTPNDDAYNPVFIPIQFEWVSSAEVHIIDRWGKEIFRSADVAGGWDGTNTHAGVYYYFIQYNGKNGKSGSVNGWVHLIR